MLVLAKVTLFEILPLKYNVKRFSVSCFGLCVYPVLCGVRLVRAVCVSSAVWCETESQKE
jgi:hypothetical protein